jgi:hypothetical protein
LYEKLFETKTKSEGNPMGRRGPKSAAQLAINNVDGTPHRLTPPPGLTAQERKLFVQLIAATSPDHFAPGDIPMLIAYPQAVLLSHKLGRDPDNVADWEKCTRVMSSLAVRLRLCPHSRVRAESARLQPKAVGPWHREKRRGEMSAATMTKKEHRSKKRNPRARARAVDATASAVPPAARHAAAEHRP